MREYLSFDFPVMLVAFFVFIPVFIYDVFKRKNIDREKHNSFALPANLNKKAKLSVLFFRLFLSFSIIAASGPRWGTGLEFAEYRRGLDAVLAIDVSRSMDIRDALGIAESHLEQSRLSRGLMIAGETVMSVSGARFAAAIGRSRGYLTVPLTWDNEAVLSFVDTLDGSSMTGRSTNLEALLNVAADAFQNSSAAHKIIILISDGEAHEGIIANAINRCVRDGVIINTVALGSDTGRSIQESTVISRRNIVVMRTAAERTGGICIDGSRNDASSVLSANLLSIAHEIGHRNTIRESKERRNLFIIFAIISYGLSKFLSRSLPNKHSPHLLLSSIFIILTFTSCSESKLLLLEANYLSSRGRYDEALVPYYKALNSEDAAPYAEFGLGLTFYLLDEGNVALKRYSSSQQMLENLPAEEHHELRYRISYNSGIIFFENGDYHSAAAAFKNALRADPKRIEAKHNLELSLMSIFRETEKINNPERQQKSETREIIFEYLKQNEQQQWRSRDWEPEENYTGLDY